MENSTDANTSRRIVFIAEGDHHRDDPRLRVPNPEKISFGDNEIRYTVGYKRWGIPKLPEEVDEADLIKMSAVGCPCGSGF